MKKMVEQQKKQCMRSSACLEYGDLEWKIAFQKGLFYDNGTKHFAAQQKYL